MSTLATPPQTGSPGATVASPRTVPLRPGTAVALGLGAAACFHVAYYTAGLAFFLMTYLLYLAELRRLPSIRQAFYAGFGTGLAVFAPQLFFFWEIFKYAALPLWLILAFWHGLFVLLVKQTESRWGTKRAMLLAAVFWTGLEYFRCELYYLRFAWITPGGACDQGYWLALPGKLGVYGAGFSLALIALSVRPNWSILVTILFAGGLAYLPPPPANGPEPVKIEVAGAQLESPGAPEVMASLKEMVARHPNTRLLVLSEYTFDGPVPETILAWCHRNDRYLIAGGKEPLPDKKFRNTVFVVGPDGKIVFSQTKAVPIQFFDDGLPAGEQKVWQSPWGAIGICVCYDLSFTRVVDRLARLGAQAIIVPTMDVEQWGAHQHELHRRIGRLRAAEYRLPVMRLASSGISQIVNRDGVEQATAPFPGQGEIIHGFLQLEPRGTPHLPPDRMLAPGCVGITGLAALILLVQSWRERRRIAG